MPNGKIASTPDRFFGLDTLRALAIAVVMLYHLTISANYLGASSPSLASDGWVSTSSSS
jgi:peptidoglycan/LPS O-acetylase OafA/YrhL